MNIKGNLSLLILYLLAHKAAHGYQLARDIKQRSQGLLDFKEGTLYPTLHLLEKEGEVESETQIENGRLRRYYRLTDSGRARLAAELAAWQQYAYAVNLVLNQEQA